METSLVRRSDAVGSYVEAAVTLRHDAPKDEEHPRRRPCGGVAQVATVSWLVRAADPEAEIKLPACNGCGRRVTLDDVTGDEPYVPAYITPPTRGR